MTETRQSSLFFNHIGDAWENMFVSTIDNKMSIYERIRTDIPASLSNRKNKAILEIILKPGLCDAKIAKVGMSQLSKLKRSGNKSLPSSFFFNIVIVDLDEGEKPYKFAAASEEDRKNWVKFIKSIGSPPEVTTARLKQATSPMKSSSGGRDGGFNNTINSVDSFKASQGTSNNASSNTLFEKKKVPVAQSTADSPNKYSHFTPMIPHLDANIYHDQTAPMEDDDEAGDGLSDLVAITDGDDDKKNKEYRIPLIGLKAVNLIRFMKVLFGYPFAIAIGVINPPSYMYYLRNPYFIYFMNALYIFGIPLLLIQFVLMRYDEIEWIQQLTIGCFFVLLYLLPISILFVNKLVQQWTSSNVVDGSFMFKPGYSVSCTIANAFQFLGFAFDWFLLLLMVFPKDIFANATTFDVSEYPPYLSYTYYFWIVLGLTYTSGLIVLLTAVLRGKTLYRFLKWSIPWHFLFFINNVLLIPMTLILIMSMVCDHTLDEPSMYTNTSIQCYDGDHLVYARGGAITLCFLIVQQCLLPAGTFKETIMEGLEVVFVPNYLSVQTILKIIFAGIYTLFYSNEITRVVALTGIALIMLLINMKMKPCCIKFVNSLRDTFFVHIVLCGLTSIVYISYNKLYENNTDVDTAHTRAFMYAILATNIVFTSLGMLYHYIINSKYAETEVASNLVEIENNHDDAGYDSRAIEPLISMCISAGERFYQTGAVKNSGTITSFTANNTENRNIDNDTKEMLVACRRYIPKLISFITHPAIIVQFQGLWALSSLCLYDEESRVLCETGGAAQAIFKYFNKFSYLVQLEALATLANLSISSRVSEDLVRKHDCIPFFVKLIKSNDKKLGLISLVCVGNLAKREKFRNDIRLNNGIEGIVMCLMSHDYQKRRYGALALSNMALSEDEDVERVFQTRGLVERIMKMAKRNEVETQREIVALVRNLACHANLRPTLLDSGIMTSIESFRSSIHEGVAKWADDIQVLMQRELNMGTYSDFKSKMKDASNTKKRPNKDRNDKSSNAGERSMTENDKKYIKDMAPIDARVEWTIWSSKLDSIFSPFLDSVPTVLHTLNCETSMDTVIEITLSACLDTSTYFQWKDDMKFIVHKQPQHGEELMVVDDDVGDKVYYSPKEGYKGKDSFTYFVQLGVNVSKAVTINITIVGDELDEGANEIDIEAAMQAEADGNNDNSHGVEGDSNGAKKGRKHTRRSTFGRLLSETETKELHEHEDNEDKVERRSASFNDAEANSPGFSWSNFSFSHTYGSQRDDASVEEKDHSP